jgi:SAM-dependent methyltransferase
MRLNIGSGRDVRPDWVNLDHPDVAAKIEGIVPCDIDQPELRLPFDDNTFEVIEASHVLEHLNNLLPFMQEVHRVATPDAAFFVEVPYGSSDDAWEDPTHVRAFFAGSWAYFSAPTYWRSDYGYRGDWKPEAVLLVVDQLRYPMGEQQSQRVIADVMQERNVVTAMKAVLKAVKPPREWSDEGGMDKWETRIVFADMTQNDPEAARENRIEKLGVVQ